METGDKINRIGFFNINIIIMIVYDAIALTFFDVYAMSASINVANATRSAVNDLSGRMAPLLQDGAAPSRSCTCCRTGERLILGRKTKKKKKTEISGRSTVNISYLTCMIKMIIIICQCEFYFT